MSAFLFYNFIMVKMILNGICRNVSPQDVKKYLAMGFKSVGCIEPQPSQEGLYVIDDYTIGRLDSTVKSK